MSIGLCCQYIEEQKSPKGKISYKNLFEEKVLQYGKFLKEDYTQQQITEVWLHNISKLKNLLPLVHSKGIKSFRLSSGYFPLYDSVNDTLTSNVEIKKILSDIGDFAIKNNIRLTCHPDQFTVLSSKNPNVIENSKRMLKHHAWMMDCMGLPKNPHYAINIHGGVKGEIQKLVEQTNQLPDNVKNRLTFENDERSYSVKDLYEVYLQTGVPIVLDTHHHTFNDAGMSIDKALDLSISTWGSHKPLTHLSNTDPSLSGGSFTERRKHSDYVHYIPEYQKNLNNEDLIDIDFEFKMKQLAIFKAVNEFDIKL